MNYLRNIEERGRDANPFFRLLDIKIISYKEGHALLSMRVREDMHNGEGWLQGGIYTAIADEAMALAIYPSLDEVEHIATVSANTTFIKGIREGTLTAEARILKRGKRFIFAEADVKTHEREPVLLTRSSAVFSVSKMP